MLPDVRAISETFPQFNIIGYVGLMLPQDTPASVIEMLNKEVNRILTDDATRIWMEKQGMIARGGSPEDFRQRIESDYQVRGELIRTLGLTGE